MMCMARGSTSGPRLRARRRAALTLFLLLAVLLSACGRVTSAYTRQDVSGRTIQALSTVGMVGDVVARVGGERVRSETLMGPGVDPHLYKPSESHVLQIAEADIVFYVGLHLEGRMTEVLERTSDTRPVVAVSEGIPEERLIRTEEFASAHDPHVWMDVSL